MWGTSVRATFIHVVPPRDACFRSRSCPPELDIDGALVLAARREDALALRAKEIREKDERLRQQEALRAELRRRREQEEEERRQQEALVRRRLREELERRQLEAAAMKRQREEEAKRKELADLAFLEECRLQKISELWESLSVKWLAHRRRASCAAAVEIGQHLRWRWVPFVRNILQLDEDSVLVQAVALLGEDRVHRMMSRPRVTCDRRTFHELMWVLSKGEPVFNSLRRIGVVRHSRREPDAYTLWCAEEVLAEESGMRLLIDMTTRASRVQVARCFHVFLTGETPLVYPWVHDLTMERVQEAVARDVQLTPRQYLLMYMGKRLRPGRPFSELGIRPGGCVQLERV